MVDAVGEGAGGIEIPALPNSDEPAVVCVVPRPEDADVESLLETFLRRLVPLLERYGLHELEALPEHALDALQLSSAQSKLPLGSPHPPRRSRRCATLEGFSLHANTRVHENDRAGLETLCRYGARGPLSLERLSLR